MVEVDPMWEWVLRVGVIWILIPGSFMLPVLAVGALVRYVAKRRRSTTSTSTTEGQAHDARIVSG